MAQSLVGALRISLGLDTAKFEDGSKRARSIAKRDATEMQRLYTGLSSKVSALMTGAALVGLGAAAKRALDYAASLGEISQQVGVTVEQLQEYRFAATQVNISQGEMEGGLARLTKTLGEAANGNKRQVTTFHDLGVSIRDVNDDVRATGDVLPELADAFTKIKDPATQARIAAELFGRQAGQKMLPLLTGGAAGIKKFADEAHAAGMVMSKELSDKADAASDKLAKLGKQMEGQFAAAVAESADGIVVLGDALSRLMELSAKAIVGLRNLGIEARKALAAGGGWTITGKPVKGEIGMANRAEYFRQSVAGDPKVQAWLKSQDKSNKPGSPLAGELTALSGGKGRSASAARPERDRSAEYLQRFNDDLASMAAQELSLRQQLATEIDIRLQLEREQINLAAELERNAITRSETDGELTKVQANRLRAGAEYNRRLEMDLAESRARDELTREEYRTLRARIDNELDMLGQQAAMARTQGQREKIALQMLDLEFKREGLLSKEVQALENSSIAERGIAERRLKTLDTLKDGSQRDIRDQYAGPLASLIKSMPKNADEINEAFERIAAEGLRSINDELTDAIMGSKSLGEAFRNVANQIVSDLIRIQIQQALIKPLSEALNGGGRSFGGGGVPSTASVGKQNAGTYADFAKAIGVPGWNSGGAFNVKGVPGVDRNILQLNGAPVARVSHGERVTVSPNGQGNNSRGGGIAHIVPSKYFDVVVDGRVVSTGGPMIAQSHQSVARGSALRNRQRLA